MAEPRTPRGFVLVIAALLVVAVSALAISAFDLAGTANLSEVSRRNQLLAEQIAELGLARATREARRMSTDFLLMDLDRILDPDGSGTLNGDEYLPASSAITMASSGSFGGWGASTDTVAGLAYRSVSVDMDGDGVPDGAYLVRYSDNRDDDLATPVETTGNTNGFLEGPSAGTDVPQRDRDQSIVMTSIGIAGSTTYATAPYRHTLRGLLYPSGGKAVLVAGDYDVGTGNNATELCGNGATICGDTADLNKLSCWCGDIRAPSFPAGFTVGSKPMCATPSPCGYCEEQSLTVGSCTTPPVPTAPPPVTFVNRTVNNFTASAGLCHFYVHDNGLGDERVYLWDRHVNSQCGAQPPTAAIPTPDHDYANAAPSFPSDCWIAIADTSFAGQNGTAADFIPGQWSVAFPSGFNPGDIIPLQTEIATRLAWGATDGFHMVPRTWAAECSCTMCNSASTTSIYNYGGEDFSMQPSGAMPKGTYFFRVLESADLDLHNGGPDVAIVADVTAGKSVRVATNGMVLTHPLGCSAATRYAVITDGNCDLSSNSVEMNYGVWCGGNLSSSQIITFNGDVIIGGNINTATNSVNVRGGCPPADGTLATIWAGGDCRIKNGPSFYASVKCVGNVEMKNNGTIYGSIWAGGDISAGNNTSFNPLDSTSSLLGSIPRISGVQSVPY